MKPYTQLALFPELPASADPSDYFKKKADSGKLPYHLLPLDVLSGVVKVLDFGAIKYAPESWRTVPNAYSRYWSALLRHLAAIQAGELLDAETGLPHLYHVACNAMFLCFFIDAETGVPNA